jgi:hypothetical protein
MGCKNRIESPSASSGYAGLAGSFLTKFCLHPLTIPYLGKQGACDTSSQQAGAGSLRVLSQRTMFEAYALQSAAGNVDARAAAVNALLFL